MSTEDKAFIELARIARTTIFETSATEVVINYKHWKIKAIRLYNAHASFLAWVPLYYLIDVYTDEQYGGYSKFTSFIRWASKFMQRRSSE